MQGETLPFLLISSINTVKQPSNESTPIPWLITGNKDKERREEGTGEHSRGLCLSKAEEVVVVMKMVVVSAKRRGWEGVGG